MGSLDDRAFRIDGEKVRKCQQKVGLNIAQLADAAEVSAKSLGRWLGGSPAYMSNIKRLADALGVTTCDLLCDDQDVPDEE